MKTDHEILTSLLHTVQMGQIGIRSVMDRAKDPALQKELRSQLATYDAIEKQTLRLAVSRGWQLSNLNPALGKMSEMMSRVRLMGSDADSKIAGMLIQGNTRGMILGTKNLHKSEQTDPQVKALADQLLDQEHTHIQKSRQFL